MANNRKKRTRTTSGKNEETDRSNNNQKNGDENFQHIKLNHNKKSAQQPIESILHSNLVTIISDNHLKEKKNEKIN